MAVKGAYIDRVELGQVELVIDSDLEAVQVRATETISPGQSVPELALTERTEGSKAASQIVSFLL